MEIHTPKIVFNQPTVSGTTYYTAPFDCGPVSIQIDSADGERCGAALELTNHWDVGTRSSDVKWYRDSTTINAIGGSTVSGTEMTHLTNINAFKARLRLTPSGTRIIVRVKRDY